MGVPYQTSVDLEGSSDSATRLRAIQLPENLAGKAILDLGCGEGYFCIEAKRRGASYVLGMDSDAEAISRARRRAPEIEFAHQSWDVLPDKRFDIILMLSVLEHERRPRELLQKVRQRLAPDGLLILECWVSSHQGTTVLWARGQEDVVYPTWDLVFDRYLAPYAVRWVAQTGGAPHEARHVFHCRVRKPIVILITGPSLAGKSTLLREIKPRDCTVLAVDALLWSMKDARATSAALPQLVKSAFEQGCDIGQVVRLIESKGLTGVLAATLVDQVPLDERLVLVEGYGLTLSVMRHVTEALEETAIVWVAKRVLGAASQRSLEEGKEAELMLAHGRLQQLAAEHERVQAELESLRQRISEFDAIAGLVNRSKEGT